MNSKLLLIAISVAALSSCSTVYKSGQTPDDVYFSPTRTYDGGDNRDNREDKTEARQVWSEERVIRLGVNDRRYRYFDNDYAYNPYHYGFNNGYYYNPYFWPYPVYNTVFTAPTNPKNTTPRVNNLGGYGNVYNNTNNTPVSPKIGNTTVPLRVYNNRNTNGSAFGNAIRKIFTPDNNSNYNNNNSNNSNNNTNRTYTPSTNSSSSKSSSSGSSSGSVSRPPRSGGGN